MDSNDVWNSDVPGAKTLDFLKIGDDANVDKLKETLRRYLSAGDKWSAVYDLIESVNTDAEKFENLIKKLNVDDKSKTGVPLIIYCIVYDKSIYLQSLLLRKTSKKGLDLNLVDDLFFWSPLMWACYLDRIDCVSQMIRFVSELNLWYTSPAGESAESLLVPGTSVYSFMDIHQVFKILPKDFSSDLYKEPELSSGIDPTMDELNLQTAGMQLNDDLDEDVYYFKPKKETLVEQPSDIPPDSEFNYAALEARQYIAFTSIDIDQLAELVCSLPQKYPHSPSIAASLTFQCIRYAHHKRHNRTMVESVFNSCIDKLLELDTDKDILKEAYSLGYMNFLYYYMSRDERLFKDYPQLLQSVINFLLGLIKTLSHSINERLRPLLIPAILDYATISDVKETLYKNDWNFFKKRKIHRLKHDSYDEILKLLYPPSVKEQMKPTPVKIVQIFGALTYVFELNDIHPIFLQQCLSISLKWMVATLFNELIQSKKLLSRTHAMQIKLNLSVLQDWVKNHNFTVEKPGLMDDFMWQRFPLTLVQDVGAIDLASDNVILENVLFFKPVEKEPCKDELNSLFFYQPFVQIWHYHLEPLHQLLQWLQIATSLHDYDGDNDNDAHEQSLQSILDMLTRLNVTQLFKSLDRYRYEIGEPKTSLKKKLKQRVKQLEKPEDVLLPDGFTHFLTLPTMNELFSLYVECERNYRFLPILPMDLQDSIDDIHDQQQMDEFDQHGSEMFGSMHEPKPVAQTVWSTNELQENPW